MIEMLFGGILAAVPMIQAEVTRRLEHRDQALLALYAALTETQAHMLKRGRRDPAEEKRLSDLWFAASVPLRHFNAELAGLCEYKRDYWSNPARWSGDDRINTAIKLDAMSERFEEIKRSVLTAFVSKPAIPARPKAAQRQSREIRPKRKKP